MFVRPWARAWLKPAGSGLIWVFFFVCMFNYPLFGFTDPSSKANNPFNMGFMAALAVVLIVTGLTAPVPSVRGLLDRRRVLPIAATAVSIGALIAVAFLNATGATASWLYVAAGLMAGAGLAVFLVYWFSDCSALKDSIPPVIVPLDFLLGAVLAICTLAMPRPLALGLVVLVILTASLCVVSHGPAPWRQEPRGQRPPDSRAKRLGFWLPELRRSGWFGEFISYAVCTFVLSVVYTLVGQIAISVPAFKGFLNVMTLTDVVGAAVVTLPIVVLAKLNLPQTYKVVFFTLSTALLFFPFLGESYWVFTNNIVALTYYMFLMRLIILLAQESGGLGQYGVVLFCLVSGLGFAFTLVGVAVGTVLATAGGFDLVRLFAVAIACVYVMSIALTSIATRRGPATRVTRRGRRADLEEERRGSGETRLAAPGGAAGILQLADNPVKRPLWSLSEAELSPLCDAFTNQHRLTQREREMLPFIVRGKSSPEISKTLFLATSTVKGHMYHLYRKCGVHSKQELIDLLDRHDGRAP
ncbi:MAG: LuxR C-terminal-related transcriptional regulator [Bifidobacteriaceae bacterium]|nr:LuxR C-terminal-related transcriptional regulator [Bifidobacteriaceae bacterium]